MNKLPETARIHLLTAKSAPVVIIIRRKPSKIWHIIKWNTRKATLEHGSWFEGKLYPMRCDVSSNGQWMVYLAMGRSGKTWNGVCHLPWLKTIAEAENTGTWYGGGFWDKSGLLLTNGWQPEGERIPFRIGQLKPEYGGEDFSVLFPRMQRDGWQRASNSWGKETRLKGIKSYQVKCEGDDGWFFRPTSKHPTLRMKYLGYLEKGYTFRFSLDEYPDLLDGQVDWANWDYGGNLVFARLGAIYKYEICDLDSGRPTFSKDLEHLQKNDI